jgi:hypothetical protein
VTQAIFGLVGVVVGALVAGSVSLFMEHRREKQKARASARLLEEELEPFVGPLYQLRASLLKPNEIEFQAFIAQRRAFTLDLWRANREVLASTLAIGEWYSIMYAYVALAKLMRALDGVDFARALNDDSLRDTIQNAESAVTVAVDTLGRLGGRDQLPWAGLLRASRW